MLHLTATPNNGVTAIQVKCNDVAESGQISVHTSDDSIGRKIRSMDVSSVVS